MTRLIIVLAILIALGLVARQVIAPAPDSDSLPPIPSPDNG